MLRVRRRRLATVHTGAGGARSRRAGAWVGALRPVYRGGQSKQQRESSASEARFKCVFWQRELSTMQRVQRKCCFKNKLRDAARAELFRFKAQIDLKYHV
ncbi:hypothetical protein NDU88_003550 [Pleurodeles waltl]|uniref:Uncharacterized protein n=1 Tax=Pleurodeles waltl TaxID=8319 RepID=A0AAV7VEH6_PLEWA|nr:hypothetical protein NDU88_003550 [Pleurodeles waltl]